MGINVNNSFLASKWQVCYAGIAKANSVIQEVPLVKDGSEAGDVGQNAIAEARFLRGIYHFELAKIWRNVPYADETATYQGVIMIYPINLPAFTAGDAVLVLWLVF